MIIVVSIVPGWFIHSYKDFIKGVMIGAIKGRGARKRA